MKESTHRDENTQAAWHGGIAAITLFVEDLAAAKRFYSDVFQLPASAPPASAIRAAISGKWPISSSP
jgi:predicted enzyme related to lactoylglutathione lyase